MKKVVSITLAIGILVFASLLYVLLNNHYVIDTLTGNKTHSLSCDDLPAVDEAQSVVSKHKDVVREIISIDPSLITIDIDNRECGSRADIVITVGSDAEKRRVEEIIQSDNFFGVPYRIINM